MRKMPASNYPDWKKWTQEIAEQAKRCTLGIHYTWKEAALDALLYQCPDKTWRKKILGGSLYWQQAVDWGLNQLTAKQEGQELNMGPLKSDTGELKEMPVDRVNADQANTGGWECWKCFEKHKREATCPASGYFCSDCGQKQNLSVQETGRKWTKRRSTRQEQRELSRKRKRKQSKWRKQSEIGRDRICLGERQKGEFGQEEGQIRQDTGGLWGRTRIWHLWLQLQFLKPANTRKCNQQDKQEDCVTPASATQNPRSATHTRGQSNNYIMWRRNRQFWGTLSLVPYPNSGHITGTRKREGRETRQEEEEIREEEASHAIGGGRITHAEDKQDTQQEDQEAPSQDLWLRSGAHRNAEGPHHLKPAYTRKCNQQDKQEDCVTPASATQHPRSTTHSRGQSSNYIMCCKPQQPWNSLPNLCL